jgi:hypothetical protein
MHLLQERFWLSKRSICSRCWSSRVVAVSIFSISDEFFVFLSVNIFCCVFCAVASRFGHVHERKITTNAYVTAFRFREAEMCTFVVKSFTILLEF